MKKKHVYSTLFLSMAATAMLPNVASANFDNPFSDTEEQPLVFEEVKPTAAKAPVKPVEVAKPAIPKATIVTSKVDDTPKVNLKPKVQLPQKPIIEQDLVFYGGESDKPKNSLDDAKAQLERIKSDAARAKREAAEKEKQAKILEKELIKQAALQAEQERKLKLEQEQKQREEAEKIRLEKLNKARLEKERIEREFKEKQQREREEARLRLQAEKEERDRLEAERIAKLKADAEAKVRAELAEKERIEFEKAARLKIEAEQRAAAEAKAKLEAEQRAAAEAKAKAEAQKRAEAEAKAKAKAEAERLAAEAKAKAKAEAERLAAEAEAKAKAKTKLEAEQRAAAEAKAKLEAEQRAAAKAMQEAEQRAESNRMVIPLPLPTSSENLANIQTGNISIKPTYASRATQSALQRATAKIAINPAAMPLRNRVLGYTATKSQIESLNERYKYDSARMSIMPKQVGEIKLLPVARLTGDTIALFHSVADKKLVEEYMSYNPLHAQVFSNYVKRIMTLNEGKTDGVTVDKALMDELVYDFATTPIQSTTLSNAQDQYLYITSRLNDADQIKFWNWVNIVKTGNEVNVPSWIGLADVMYSQ